MQHLTTAQAEPGRANISTQILRGGGHQQRKAEALARLAITGWQPVLERLPAMPDHIEIRG